MEANAVASALASQRSAGSPLVVGSVKTNIGHLEAASGLAGIIKSTLTLETGLIPPNINFEKPNKEIPLAKLKLKVIDLLFGTGYLSKLSKGRSPPKLSNGLFQVCDELL